jgi:hypothetical protein
MRIVAFLQNPWFRAGTSERHIDRYTTDPVFRRVMLAQSMTGRRLYKAFGPNYSEIWWDNVSTHSGKTHRELTVVELDHVGRVIIEQDPLLILTFGNVARDAVARVENWAPVLACHHPNAMHYAQEDLNEFATMALHFYQGILHGRRSASQL